MDEVRQPLGLIVAYARNRCIGVNNELPWHYPEDMKRFRKVTRKHIVIMGRKTYESIFAVLGKPLPGRRNMILSRDPTFKAEGCETFTALSDALNACKTGKFSEKIPVIIGGAEIYKLAMPLVTRMWLTIIKKNYEGDSFFPRFIEDEWDILEREDFGEFEFKTLERRNSYLDLK